MNRRFLIATVAVLPLAACAGTSVASVEAGATAAVGKASTILSNVIADWGIAKGIAEIATTYAAAALPPGAAAIIAVAIMAGDALVATVTAALNAGTADVASAATLAHQLQEQAQVLRLTAAPVVKIIAG